MKKILFFGLMMLCIVACESRVEIKVTCKDAETGETLPGVQVAVNAGMNRDYTKSTQDGQTNDSGYFETDLMIGCPGKCYDIYITYTKAGYKIKKDLNITEGEILLEKETN